MKTVERLRQVHQKILAAAFTTAALALLTPTIGISAVYPDPDFGNDEGITETQLSGIPAVFVDAIRLANGKILTVGYAASNSSTALNVARLNADGSLDTSFGNGDGFTNVSFNGYSSARGMGIAPLTGGGIAVAGYADNGSDNDFVAAVLDSDGSDPRKWTRDFGGTSDFAWDITVDGMGGLLIAGESRASNTSSGPIDGVVVKLDASTLSLDNGFSGDGIFTRSSSANDNAARYLNVEVRTTSNNKIVLAGNTDTVNTAPDALLTQLDPDGTADSDFGNGAGATGDFVLAESGSEATPWAMELAGDGRILLAGSARDIDTSEEAIVVAKVLMNGTGLDSSFGANASLPGTTILNPAPGREQVFDLEIDSKGRMLFVGRTETASLFGRLDAAGTPDSEFADSGIDTFDAFSGDELLYGVVLNNDETFVGVGGYDGDSSVPFVDTAFALGGTTESVAEAHEGGASTGGSGGGGGGALGLHWLSLLCVLAVGRLRVPGRVDKDVN